MDDLINNLIEKLKDDFAVNESELTDLFASAKAEALAEAKITLKNLLVQNILRQTLPTKPLAVTDAVEISPTQPPSTAAALSDSEKQVRQEIIALRQQLAHNERQQPRFAANAVQAVPFLEAAKSTASNPSSDYGYYIYGIIYDDSQQPVKGLSYKGLGLGLPLYAIPYQSIQAVISKVSLAEFGPPALKANLQNKSWLETNAQSHQHIIESIMADHRLMAMRFCTVCLSEDEVMELLIRYYDEFIENLDRLADKQEWGVKIYSDGHQLRQIVPKVSPRVKELATSLNGKSEGAAYLLKKKLSQVVIEEAEQLGRRYAAQSHDSLLECAEAAVDLPLADAPFAVDRQNILFNGTYLVAEACRDDFQAIVERLTTEYAPKGLTYELTGPQPPYSFIQFDGSFPFEDKR